MEDMPDYGDNQTIAHSPCPLPGMCLAAEREVDYSKVRQKDTQNLILSIVFMNTQNQLPQ